MARLATRFAGPDSSPGFLLWRVTNHWQSTIRRVLAPHGLTHVQFVLLATLCWNGSESGMTQARLARSARVDPMMTSQVVRTLERAGLVARPRHPLDRRARLLAPTPAGRRVADAATVAVEAADAAFFTADAERPRSLVEHLLALDREPEAGPEGERSPSTSSTPAS